MNLADIEEKLKPLADSLGVAVKELWKIWCREFLVRGSIQLLGALFFLILYFKLNFPVGWWQYVKLIFLAPMLALASSGLRYALNPAYHAIRDLSEIIQEISK